MKKLLSLTLVMLMLITSTMLTSCDAILDMIFPKESIVRTVTEEEWYASLEITNFEVIVDINHTTWVQKGNLKFTDNGSHVKYISDGTEIENMTVCQNGVWYSIEKKGDTYVGVESRDYTYTLGEYLEGVLVIPGYSEFTFDEARGAYVKGEYSEYGTQEMLMHFENGVLTKFEILANGIDPNGNEVSGYMTFEIVNVGTTVIDIPEFTVAS